MHNKENQGFSYQRLILEWMSATIANGFASAVLNPMDVSKTRMQAESVSSSYSRGLITTLSKLYQQEGLIGLWKPGLNASLARELLYSGPRAGFYVPLRNFCEKEIYGNNAADHPSTKVFAALVTGTLGSFIANPIDVAKIRLMVNPQLYPTLSNAIGSIYETEGWRGLYKGLVPSTLRGMLSEINNSIIKCQFSQGLSLQWESLPRMTTVKQ
jgi:hypothetical protein